MEDKKITPIRRDWLHEAYRIAQGDVSVNVKREHVIEAMKLLISFSNEAENLRKLMRHAYNEACKRREESGLPVPPMPPGLDKEPNTPWKS